jgi:S1-C subfamily serine protease
VPSLITIGSYSHPLLGVVGIDITPQIAEALDLEIPSGFFITELAPGSPAETAGIHGGNVSVVIQGEEVLLGGDILIAINNNTVRKIDDILTYLEREKEVGDMINL